LPPGAPLVAPLPPGTPLVAPPPPETPLEGDAAVRFLAGSGNAAASRFRLTASRPGGGGREGPSGCRSTAGGWVGVPLPTGELP
jgi:hypothetical protein